MAKYRLSVPDAKFTTEGFYMYVSVIEETPGGATNDDLIGISDGGGTYTTKDVFLGNGKVKLEVDIAMDDKNHTGWIQFPIDVTVVNPTNITIDGQPVSEITIDGEVVNSLSIDGTQVF